MGSRYSLSINFTVQYTHCNHIPLKRQMMTPYHGICIIIKANGILVKVDGESEKLFFLTFFGLGYLTYNSL